MLVVSITFDDISPAYLSVCGFKNLIDFLDDVDVTCTFFIVPYDNKLDYPTRHEFTSCLKDAINKGHELALHGYKHTKNEFGCFYPIPLPIPFPPFRRQIESLKKGVAFMKNVLGVRPLGFRAPYYLHNKATLKALSSLSFDYDSSVTVFKPTHSLRLRMKWFHNCKPFVKEGVVEIPVSGDYTYNLKYSNFYEFFRMAMRDFEWISLHQGVFVMNNHPQFKGNVGYRFLRTLIRSLSKKTEFLTLRDVAKMYR